MVGGAIVANATLDLGVAIVLISGAMFVAEYVRSYRA